MSPFNVQMDIEITNVDQIQASQIIKFLNVMSQCGESGSSRWLCFFSDGDGAFRPRIKLDGKDIRKFDGTGRGDWEKQKEMWDVFLVNCDG